MSTRRSNLLAGTVLVAVAVASGGTLVGRAQGAAAPAPRFLPTTPLPPLFFRAALRQTRPFDASTGFRPEAGITPAALADPQLELKLYDPGARNVPAYLKNPPPGSGPVDWDGPSCIQLGGYNQDPPPAQVVAGAPSDPPNMWTGVCQTPVAATIRHRRQFVNLTGMAKIRWVTRTSGFHVVRPLLKLADGTWLVGDYGDGGATANSMHFLESEFAVSSVRWLPLDITRVVTRGERWVEKPDLSRVDEVGFADLLPGSGHGWGGFVNVARIEVYGAGVAR
jgi:hypothetical protein